jgi:hypothetical protein
MEVKLGRSVRIVLEEGLFYQVNLCAENHTSFQIHIENL